MNKLKHLIFILLTMGFILINNFIAKSQTTASKQDPAFDSLDVQSINRIITSVYDLISGPAGERNWARFRSFFIPEASFVSVKVLPNGTEEYFIGNLDDYIKKIEQSLRLYTYYENEVERNIQSADNIANVFSSYESSLFSDKGTINQRGTNSFQLIYKNNRWWITDVLWKNEPLELLITPGK